jgi:hypothetical protein
LMYCSASETDQRQMNCSMAFTDIYQMTHSPLSFVLIHIVYTHLHAIYSDVILFDSLWKRFQKHFILHLITFINMEILFYFYDCCHPEITQQKNDILFMKYNNKNSSIRFSHQVRT